MMKEQDWDTFQRLESQLERLYRHWGVLNRVGHPDDRWMLRNLETQIGRIEDRLMSMTPPAIDENVTRKYLVNGANMWDDVEADELRIELGSKDVPEIRAKLEALGFRWNPSTGTMHRARSRKVVEPALNILLG